MLLAAQRSVYTYAITGGPCSGKTTGNIAEPLTLH
jgi:hypothetical protein